VLRNAILRGAGANLRRSGNCRQRARAGSVIPRVGIPVSLMLPDAIFLDEAMANLEAMDLALADIGITADLNAVHAVFCHAHSIKGGAGAFGLQAMAEMMHLIESVLDLSRRSGVPPDGATAELLRDAVDVARHMLVDDGGLDRNIADNVAMRLRQRVLAPDAPRAPDGGALRRITIRSADTDRVSAAVVGLFADIAGLGELLSMDRGAEGDQLFLVRTLAGDHELMDLLAMHVERDKVSIAAVPAAPIARRVTALGGYPFRGAHGATVRVDAEALRSLVMLARKLTRARADAGIEASPAGAGTGKKPAGAEFSPGQPDIDALCQGLMDLGSAPVGNLLGRIPPLLRRLSGQLNKQFELSVTGVDVRIDRALLQSLADPLMHLVRNACDHGIELEAQRLAAGKPRAGQIDVSAWREPGTLRISVRDDGAGLSRDKVLRAARARAIALPVDLDDQAVWQLVFEPGLSTAHSLSHVSGRGVGMDAVQRQVASLGGDVSITSSAGKGVCVTVSIPVDVESELKAVG